VSEKKIGRKAIRLTQSVTHGNVEIHERHSNPRTPEDGEFGNSGPKSAQENSELTCDSLLRCLPRTEWEAKVRRMGGLPRTKMSGGDMNRVNKN